jgi:hypothetical protein
MDGKERFGLLSAQAGGEKTGPGLYCFNIRAGLGNRVAFLFWARPELILGWNQLKNFDLVFCFSIF